MVHVSLSPSKHTYTHSNVRRTSWYRSKSKDERECSLLPYGNIMFDKRVVRGPVFGHPHTTTPSGMERDGEAKRRAATRRKIQRTKLLQFRLGTPPPIEGRKHDPTQTEIYVEELLDHPIEISAACQTELMLDRPESPLNIPGKNGLDVSTTIKPGDLFDFNLEVQPILAVLVGKTLEQSLAEIMEEEELESIRMQQREFKETRNAELAEEQRLQEQDTRRRLQMEYRLNEHENEIKVQNEARDRITAAVITTGYLGPVIPDVIRGLQNSGNVLDPIQYEVENVFMAWLMKEVKGDIQQIIQADVCIQDILNDIQRIREETVNDTKKTLLKKDELNSEKSHKNKDFVVIDDVLEEEAKTEEEQEKLTGLVDNVSIDFSWGLAIQNP